MRKWLLLGAVLATACTPASVYFGSAGKSVTALRASDGAFRFKAAVGGEIHRTGMHHIKVLAVGSDDGTFYGIDREHGTIAWQTPLVSAADLPTLPPRAVLSSPIVVGNRLWVFASNGVLSKIDSVTGAVTQSVDLGARGAGWLSPSSSLTRLYVTQVAASGAGGTVYAIDTPTGQVSWSAPTPQPQGPAVEGVNNGLLLPCGSLVLIDTSTGTIVGQAGSRYVGVAVASDGFIYATRDDGTAQQLSVGPLQGQINPLWTVQPSRARAFAPILMPAGVLYTALDGREALLDYRTGTTLWSSQLTAGLAGAAAFDPAELGTVVIVSPQGDAYALNPANGNVLWHQPNLLTGPIDAPPHVY